MQWCFSLLIYNCHSTPIGLASASISLVFFISNGIIEIFLNLMKKKINKHRLNGIEKKIFKTIDSDISYDEFTLVINE